MVLLITSILSPLLKEQWGEGEAGGVRFDK